MKRRICYFLCVIIIFTMACPSHSYGQGISLFQIKVGFTGELSNTDQIIYLRARHYLALLGRFAQRDSFMGFYSSPQSLNRFYYANPINTVDPSGNSSLYTPGPRPVGPMFADGGGLSFSGTGRGQGAAFGRNGIYQGISTLPQLTPINPVRAMPPQLPAYVEIIRPPVAVSMNRTVGGVNLNRLAAGLKGKPIGLLPPAGGTYRPFGGSFGGEIIPPNFRVTRSGCTTLQDLADEMMFWFDMGKSYSKRPVLGTIEDIRNAYSRGDYDLSTMQGLGSSKWSPSVNNAYLKGLIDRGQPILSFSDPYSRSSHFKVRNGIQRRSAFSYELEELQEQGWSIHPINPQQWYILPPP